MVSKIISLILLVCISPILALVALAIIFDDGSGTILEDESIIAALETVGELDDLLKMALSN